MRDAKKVIVIQFSDEVDAEACRNFLNIEADFKGQISIKEFDVNHWRESVAKFRESIITETVYERIIEGTVRDILSGKGEDEATTSSPL